MTSCSDMLSKIYDNNNNNNNNNKLLFSTTNYYTGYNKINKYNDIVVLKVS